jgi:hypothetical protein
MRKMLLRLVILILPSLSIWGDTTEEFRDLEMVSPIGDLDPWLSHYSS